MTTAELPPSPATLPPRPSDLPQVGSEGNRQPQTATSPTQSSIGAIGGLFILALSAWFGMLTGGVEGLYWMLHQLRTDSMVFMHPGYYWISPTTQMLLGLSLGLVPAVWVTLRPSTRPFAIAVWLSACVAWLNLIQLWIPGLQVWGWLLLGCGLATATRRLIAARCDEFQRIVWRTLPWMIVTLLLSAIVQRGVVAKQEADAMAALPAARKGAPNVLLVVLDTVRADAVTQDSDLTPNISRFATRGVDFSQAKATAPWTLPSQSGMFTGRLPHELSSDWWSRLDDSHSTLAEVLFANGWNTGGFVANTRYCSRETGINRGFAHYEAYRLSPGDFLLTTALGRKILMSPLPTYFGICDWPGRKRAPEISKSFLRWVEEHGDRPFFAFLNYFDAHDPYLAPPEFQTQDPPEGKDLILLRDWWWAHKDSLSVEQVEMLQTAYEDCIRGLDDQIGKLLDELNARGILENTLVIITADHGEHFGDHQLYLHGNSLYDAALGVPLKLIWPARLPGGVEVTHPVSLQDLSQTVMELLGVTANFPGESLAPYWELNEVGQPRGRRAVISEIASQAGFPPCHGRSPVAAGPMQCAQLGTWKYIRDALGTEQLFDLEKDPSEVVNLAADDRYQDQLEKMRMALRARNPKGALSPWPTIPQLPTSPN